MLVMGNLFGHAVGNPDQNHQRLRALCFLVLPFSLQLMSNPMSPRPCCSLHKPDEMFRIPMRWCWAAETVEIAIASLCSLVIWVYTVQNEVPQVHGRVLGSHVAEKHSGDFIFRPPPALMLFSCLVFGCSVSSFSHRRQTEDPFQFLIYLAVLGTVGLVGYGVRANLYLILLGYFPWATCAAMAISISGHRIWRRWRTTSASIREDEEKVQPMG
ncbi:hypothetical protein VTK26DRAFT_7653 [Humicola hyalothermophila]